MKSSLPAFPAFTCRAALTPVCLDPDKRRTSPDDGLGAEAPDGSTRGRASKARPMYALYDRGRQACMSLTSQPTILHASILYCMKLVSFGLVRQLSMSAVN